VCTCKIKQKKNSFSAYTSRQRERERERRERGFKKLKLIRKRISNSIGKKTKKFH